MQHAYKNIVHVQFRPKSQCAAHLYNKFAFNLRRITLQEYCNDFVLFLHAKTSISSLKRLCLCLLMPVKGTVAHWCNLLTLQPQKSGGRSLVQSEAHDLSAMTRDRGLDKDSATFSTEEVSMAILLCGGHFRVIYFPSFCKELSKIPPICNILLISSLIN